jgi:hypothetical protein
MNIRMRPKRRKFLKPSLVGFILVCLLSAICVAITFSLFLFLPDVLSLFVNF